MQVQYTTEIACAPEHLWTFIYEPEKQKLWMKGLLENRSTSEGPPRPGSTFHMRIKEGASVGEYDGEVLTYDPPRQLVVRFWGGNFPKGMEMRVDYRLTEQGGKTRL